MDGEIPKALEHPPWEQRWVMKRNPNEFAQGQQKVEDLFWQDVRTIAPKVLQKADKTANPTKSELAKCIENNTFRGDEAQVAAALYRGFNDIHKTNGFGFGEPRLSKMDIDAVVQKNLEVERNFKIVRDLANWARTAEGENRFAQLGGRITSKNLEIALQQPSIGQNERAKLAELKANFNSLNNGGGLLIDDLTTRLKDVKKTPEYNVMDDFQLSMIRVDFNQNNPLAHKLFADKNPLDSVTPDAVIQGDTGDCSLKAALAGYAAMRPGELKGMITSGQDGAFTVQLPGIFEKKVTVQQPTDEELGIFSGRHNDHGFWPLLFSKAFGKYEFSAKANSFNKTNLERETEDEWAGENSSPAIAMSAITGHWIDSCNVKDMNDSDLQKRIQTALGTKQIIVLGTMQGTEPTTDGYQPKHALTILSAAAENGKFEVTIRDPHNEGENKPDGKSKVDIAKLRRNFVMIFFETNRSVWSK